MIALPEYISNISLSDIKTEFHILLELHLYVPSKIKLTLTFLRIVVKKKIKYQILLLHFHIY